MRAFGYGLCPPDRVTYHGYELAAALDFENTRWALNATADGIADAVAEGWEPIGYSGNPHGSTFNGNGHTITGLCINRPTTDHVGLFGVLNGAILNVGLEEVAVHGGEYVGGLVGGNVGAIASSYATGTVMGAVNVGGLVGWSAVGSITASYATGDVVGDSYVGGLMGRTFSGSITASYATGDVVGNSGVGGLVGGTFSSSITASYATGDVAGNSDVGGLVGDNYIGLIESSYYLRSAIVTRKGTPVPPDDTARTTMALASSTLSEPALNDASGMPSIFADWSTPVDADGDASTTDVAVWDFGARNQFPVLRVDVNGDSRFSADEFGVQPREASSVVYFPSAEFVVAEEDGDVEVSVVMFNAPDMAVDVSVLVSDGTATAPDDYARDSGSVTRSFDSSSAVDFLTTKTFTIAIVDDNIVEEAETIALSLDVDALPFGVLAEGNTMATVRIDDLSATPHIRFTAATAEVAEGDTASISVSISPAPIDSVEVPIIISGGTATLDDDYTWAPVLLSFSSQTTTASFTVTIADDAVEEPAETIIFSFDTLPAGVVKGTPAMFVVTIASSDTDATPAIFSLDGRDAVRVYPNPVREMLYISVPSSAAYEVVLYTLAGVPILSAASPASLAVDALPPGVYFLSVFFDGTTHLHRLLKE